MNKTLEKILQAGMDDFEFITENDHQNITGKKLILKDYLDYDLSVLREIVDNSEDVKLVEQCEKYLEAAAHRPNKWDIVKKELVEREVALKKEPKDVEEALDMSNKAANVSFREAISPTPLQPPLYMLVDLYIVPDKDNPEFEAFLALKDVHGRNNVDFRGCNHIIGYMAAICRKDGFLICPICGKTVSLKMAEEFIANNKPLGGK